MNPRSKGGTQLEVAAKPRAPLAEKLTACLEMDGFRLLAPEPAGHVYRVVSARSAKLLAFHIRPGWFLWRRL